MKLAGIYLIACLCLGIFLTLSCTLAPPFDRLVASAGEPTEAMVRTPRPTFTPSPVLTPTPTKTPTSTVTPIPSATATPIPTATPRPTATPTTTSTTTPAPPPPPTNTPLPTDTPAPSWEFRLEELFSSPTNANILSIVTAIQTAEGGWIPGLRVVGTDPNGIVTKSEPSADHMTGNTPADSSVIKTGNTKFEPQPFSVYITGTWIFHLETADGRQVSDSFTVNMDEESREWYFFRFVPN
jgi:hypothetical protein